MLTLGWLSFNCFQGFEGQQEPCVLSHVLEVKELGE